MRRKKSPCSSALDNLATDVLIENQLTPESFYVPRHQLIYQAMRTLYDAHEAIDEVTLPQQMKDAGTFDKAGGYKALSELLSRSASRPTSMTTAESSDEGCGQTHDRCRPENRSRCVSSR